MITIITSAFGEEAPYWEDMAEKLEDGHQLYVYPELGKWDDEIENSILEAISPDNTRITVFTKSAIVFNVFRVLWKEGKFPGHDLEILYDGIYYQVDRDGRVPLDFPHYLFDVNVSLLRRLLS